MTENTQFNYTEAFSRNLGWVSLNEQQTLKQKRVAIAGLGGVGGGHLLALARLGIEKFYIADLDQFDVGNMNRQAGCTVSSFNHSKVETMMAMVKDINPNADVIPFHEGINQDNIFEFLDSVDLVVDGLDLYAPKIRRLLFAKSYEQSIPLVTAGPLGGGTACLVFDDSSPHPDHYFNFKSGQSDMELLVQFLIGLAPKALQSKYLESLEHVSPLDGKVCSLSAGSYMASGMVVVKALQILLKRGPVFAAPNFQQFDGYLNKYVSGKLRWGNRSLLQRVKAYFVMKAFQEMQLTYQPLQPDALETATLTKKAA